MSQAAKVQEPSMEEILASIRRIIADDEAGKPAPKAGETPAAPKPGPAPAVAKPAAEAPASPAEPEAMSQEDIDAMLAGFDSSPDSEAPSAPAPSSEADVLDLTEAMEARAAAAMIDASDLDEHSDVVFADPPAPMPEFEPEPESEPAPPRPRFESALESERHSASAQDAAERLLSDRATAAVTTAFGSLAHTVLMQNARTLDDLVGDMLRPMLKSWLDDNLPTIVERLVRAEIERVSRGRS
jgi:uncharacterized protein